MIKDILFPTSRQEIQEFVDSISSPSRRLINGDAFQAKLKNDKKERLYVQIICEKHGKFPKLTRLDLVFKRGGACRKCVNQTIQNYRRLKLDKAKEIILKKAKRIKQPIIDVVDLEYVKKKGGRNRPYITILCEKHGDFKVSLDSILYTNYRLCPMCGRERGGKLRLISFYEKKRLYKEKYPNSSIEFIESSAKSRIKARCKNCNNSFIATWDSLYNRGTNCRKCAIKKRALNAMLPLHEIQKRIKPLGLRIEGTYNGTHHKCTIICQKCGEKKQLKPNTVLSHKGMACKCTRSIPDFCRDLIASDFLN